MPDIADGVGKEWAGVDGGVEDFLGSREDVIEVEVVETLTLRNSSPM
jgi:hypothetical protein